MADRARARRLAKRIAQIVASALEHEIKDPRLGNVTVTDARVTGDLRDATVYYTVLGDSLDSPPDFAEPPPRWSRRAACSGRRWDRARECGTRRR